MPLYVYKCASCSRECSDIRTVAERNDGPRCHCSDQKMELVITAVPGIVKNPAVPRSKP